MRKVLILAAALTLSSTAMAQQNSRADTWEFGLLLDRVSSVKLNGSSGSNIDIDSTTGWGITLGYNFNSHWALSGEFAWASPDYDALIVPDDGFGNPGAPERIRHELGLFSYSFKGTFNLIDGPLTPYAELGLGWTEVDSNIATQPPITGCWWDPWWGYICDTFYSTYSKTRETYSGALGVRWDLDNGMSLKGSYGLRQVSTGKSTDDADLDFFRVELAWRF